MSPRGREAPSWFSPPAQALHSEKRSEKHSTQNMMKQGVKEHMIQHKQNLKILLQSLRIQKR